MKTAASILILLGALVSTALGGITLEYKLKPGQTWRCEQANQNESEFMEQKQRNRSRSVIEYRVGKGHKSGWARVEAHIVSHTTPDGGSPMDLGAMTFTAQMHASGELRDVKTSGNPMPDMGGEVPPQMREMYAQSARMVADAWKHAVFWFPELPDYVLEPGDEFEVERRIGMGGGTGMQSQTSIRQRYTLEEVSGGLAYFSVRERSVTRSKGAMGGSSDTKMAGKGEAIFDLHSGMWLELIEKSRAEVMFGGMGMDDASKMILIHRYTMELR